MGDQDSVSTVTFCFDSSVQLLVQSGGCYCFNSITADLVLIYFINSLFFAGSSLIYRQGLLVSIVPQLGIMK